MSSKKLSSNIAVSTDLLLTLPHLEDEPFIETIRRTLRRWARLLQEGQILSYSTRKEKKLLNITLNEGDAEIFQLLRETFGFKDNTKTMNLICVLEKLVPRKEGEPLDDFPKRCRSRRKKVKKYGSVEDEEALPWVKTPGGYKVEQADVELGCPPVR